MIVRKRSRNLWVDAAFILAFVGNNITLNNRVCLGHERGRTIRFGIIERICN
jgi:hypothetical protein